MLTARIDFDKLSKIEVIPLLAGWSNIIQQSQQMKVLEKAGRGLELHQGRSFSNTSSSFSRCMISPLSEINQLKERLIYKGYLQ
jgi:hypothetical protein